MPVRWRARCFRERAPRVRGARAGELAMADESAPPPTPDALWPSVPGLTDPATLARARDWWMEGLSLWASAIAPLVPPREETEEEARDKRFRDPRWREDPGFDLMRRSYRLFGDAMMQGVEAMPGDEREKERMRFAARGVIDAMSPTNFPLTNPQAIDRAVETGGESLAKGFQHLLDDMGRGQMRHTAGDAFEVGRNLATTPGKVVRRTPMYELIQYAPMTDAVLATPLIVFPPWINRFYILDLTPEKSFIRWAVEQGLSVFMVSWKSADASMADVTWDDYVAAQLDAIDTVRELLEVPAVHSIGYCVAGTTLAATLAVLAERGQADRVASATFFTAQVDFADAGDLRHFVDDEQLRMLEKLSPDGFLDGRYMAATFNALRGRDLIWNYHTNNYLMGQDYAAFDLLHWNGDTTNLPSKWHLGYLRDLYRDNRLTQPGSMQVLGHAVDLRRVETPTYVQAGREDHIAPAQSVWKITHLFSGPLRFVLAGSGHIAGVVNPPAANKYQYWTNDAGARTLDEFVAGATETKGSWWPDWMRWLRDRNPDTVPAEGARIPGRGTLPALGDAPGEYVRAR
ncbi:MAG TPA: class I poly(R)-hydroxyalkanoic acid synthase [Sphingomonas sp.]